MDLKLTLPIQPFSTFIKLHGLRVIFTFLFYSLSIAKIIFYKQNFDLHSFPNRMIGIATLQGFDVAARVQLFYTFIFLLFFSFAILYFLFYFALKEHPKVLIGVELKIINYSSLCGLLFNLFLAFGYKVEHSLTLVYYLHTLMVISILTRYLLFPENKFSISDYTFLILLSFSTYFFVADCSSLAGTTHFPDFIGTNIVLFLIVLIFTHLFIRKESAVEKQKRLYALPYIAAPLISLPLLSVLKDELFFICKSNGVNFNGQLPIYFVLITGILVLLVVRARRSINIKRQSTGKLLSHCYFPLFIFSLVTYLNYSHYIPFSSENFEAGNKYLPIMEFKLFGVLPTIEKLNSHLISDYFFSAMYTFMHGLKGAELELYDFLILPVSSALYYFLINYISRNPFVALFCVILFPLSGGLLPFQYSLAVIGIFAFNILLARSHSSRSYLITFLIISGLVFWRIDLGYSALITTLVLLLLYLLIRPGFTINYKFFLRTLFIYSAFLFIVIWLISVYRHFDLTYNITKALNYFSSAQSYGYSGIGDPAQPPFRMHYFIFPVLVSILILVMLFKFKRLNNSRGQREAYLALLFISVFYIANFNRGLVRHSLVEQVDHFTSSFVFLILPGAIFVFSNTFSHGLKYLTFSLIAFFMLLNYKVPEIVESSSDLEALIDKVGKSNHADLNKISSRVIGADEGSYREFIEFISRNTSDSETFIDFSNNPMLYFYSRKITPSYFFQNPICSHNDYLQNVFVEELKKYSTPYLIFANNDTLNRNNIDGVPNTLRHFKIAEHLYQNFSPYIVVNNFRIWKRKDVADKNTRTTIYSTSNYSSADTTIHAIIKGKNGKKYYGRIELFKANSVEIDARTTKDSVKVGIITISDTLQYFTLSSFRDSILVSVRNNNKKVRSLQIVECDYYPDLVSEKEQNLDFMNLPYIWGTYDKKVLSESVQFESGSPALIDKTSGNTVLLYCRNLSSQNQKIAFWFGNAKRKSRSLISFNVLTSTKEERYAIRVSSVYEWYRDSIDQLGAIGNNAVIISKIQITKGL